VRLIQPILVLIFCAGALLYFRFGRANRPDRLVMVVLVAVGVLLVLDPDLATSVANLIGIGRGADLVMYFGLTLLGFGGFYLYSKQRSTEARLTDLARAIAIREAFERVPPVDTEAAAQSRDPVRPA